MNSVATIVGVLLILAAVGLIIWFVLPQSYRSYRSLRIIPAFQNLRRAVGLAVEDGKRLHVSIGKASIISPNSAAGLAGLSTLEQVTHQSMVSDRPPIATAGEGSLAVLSLDTMRHTYRSANVLDQFSNDRARLTGPTPMSYVAGILPIVKDEQVAAHILVGNFGSEIGLVNDAAERERAFTLAASDALEAQAVLYAMAQEPLVGEEMFAVPAYLQAGRFHQASLRAQDVIRYGIIGIILLGAVLKILGVTLL